MQTADTKKCSTPWVHVTQLVATRCKQVGVVMLAPMGHHRCSQSGRGLRAVTAEASGQHAKLAAHNESVHLLRNTTSQQGTPTVEVGHTRPTPLLHYPCMETCWILQQWGSHAHETCLPIWSGSQVQACASCASTRPHMTALARCSLWHCRQRHDWEAEKGPHGLFEASQNMPTGVRFLISSQCRQCSPDPGHCAHSPLD